MDFDQNLIKSLADTMSATYIRQGTQARNTRQKQFSTLLSEKKWPSEPWDDLNIEMFLQELALMDSNNFPVKSGVGEREGRIYSGLVQRRHYRFSHGIGRSGDLGEVQPKAAGSSILSVLTNALVKQLCKIYVSPKIADAFIAPMATGMSLTLVLLTMKKEKPKAEYVIWPRIDQKSCFKCIITSGLKPVIIHPKLHGDELETDVQEIENQIKTLGKDNVLCVLSTTSCFAPRACDSLEEIGAICAKNDIYHLVNNAYGVQSGKCSYRIAQAAHHGRVDVVVQSTDKNLMVPVGGAIVAGFDKTFVDKICQNYPGRASSSQTLDVFVTMMSLGSNGYKTFFDKRKECYEYFKSQLLTFATEFGEKVLETPNNQISIGITLNTLPPEKSVTELGSMLFLRSICGARVVSAKQEATIEGYKFQGWGAHTNQYHSPYLTVAASVGVEKSDIDMFITKLRECFSKLTK